jgi:predicted dehydrogenase
VKAALHYSAIVPSLTAGKNIFVEWPLAATVAEASSLLALSQKHNTKLAVVGLQGRFSPVIKAIRELIDSEKLGKVLSSTFTSQAQYAGSTVVKGFEYSTDLKAGAGVVNIFFGHMVDMIQLGMSPLSALKVTKSHAFKALLISRLLHYSTGRIQHRDNPVSPCN